MLSRRTLASGIALPLLLAGAALAQQPQPAPPKIAPDCTKGELADLVKWVVARGKPQTLPAYLLGIPSAEEVPILQKAYWNKTTKISHALDVNVANGRCDVVFVLDDGGTVTTWVTNASGAVERTYFMSRGDEVSHENEIVPNEQYVGLYGQVKRYFLDKMAGPPISPISRAIRRFFGAE